MHSYCLHLLRHGAPIVPGMMLGHQDMPSSDSGHVQCVAQASRLTFTRVISSDLIRCQSPAQEIASQYGVDLTVDPRWRELDFGLWDEQSSSEIDRQSLNRFWEDPDTYPPPQGERWSDLKSRVAQSLKGLPVQDTLIVGHGGSMRAALAILCGFSHAQLWAFDVPYAASLSFRIWPSTSSNTRQTAQIIGLRT